MKSNKLGGRRAKVKEDIASKKTPPNLDIETLPDKKARSLKITSLFQARYGTPECPLTFRTVEQLAVAVILSAQCTDARVNQITPALFERFPDMVRLAEASLPELEKLIFSTGFYHNKARNIQKLAQILVRDYNAKIPKDFDVLVTLPGIGRKTANVIMSEGFGEAPGVTVDTHVKRVAFRLGFTRSENPTVVERDLMALYPKSVWRVLPLYLIFHGRETCHARKPQCGVCIIKELCPSAKLFLAESPASL